MSNEVFIHPLAAVDPGVHIGERTRIWAFAHLVSGAVVGKDCNICDHTFIEGKVRIGDRVTLKCGVYVWDGITLEDDVFVGPCAAFTNDRVPRSKRYPEKFSETIIQKGASIGANATILPGFSVGKWAMVGAGAVVTKAVPDFALVIGNPAKFVGYICKCGSRLTENKEGNFNCICERRYMFGIGHTLTEVSNENQ